MPDLIKENIRRPWVSFCISTYKRPVLLKEQLLSLLQQSFREFEIVISDNDPEKSAENVVKDINDPRVRYFANIENLGMTRSFNKSIERSSADHIIMVTDDDPVLPSMLEDFYKIVNSHPGYGIYFGCVRTGKASGEIEIFDDRDFVYQMLHPALTTNILWSSCIIKKDVVLSFGGMPDYGSPHLADHAMLALCAKVNGGVMINKMYSKLTSHDNNFSKANFELYYIGCIGFHKLITSSFDKSYFCKENTNALTAHLDNWFMDNSFILRKYFTYKKKDLKSVRNIADFSKKALQLPFMRHLRLKYYCKLLIFDLKKPIYLLIYRSSKAK